MESGEPVVSLAIHPTAIAHNRGCQLAPLSQALLCYDSRLFAKVIDGIGNAMVP